MRSDRRPRVALVAALALVLAGCDPRLPRVQVQVGNAWFTVEVARTDAERSRGLMNRTRLGAREGMLFVFDRDQHLDFWMKDTPLPLSIAFLSSEGKIEEIDDMQPLSLAVIHSRLSCRYALEANHGAFAEVGAKVGDVIALPADAR